MGDNTFVLAADGGAHITPCGEFPHAGAGVLQVIDRAAYDAIAAEFNARKFDANLPGVLVDFDHFSLDTAQSSEAAGWITELESRDTGLWARVQVHLEPDKSRHCQETCGRCPASICSVQLRAALAAHG